MATRVEAEDENGQMIDNEAFTGLFYVHGDHLGSATALSYGQDRPTLQGTLVPDSVARFLPFGEYRGAKPQTSPAVSDRGYTGHKHNDNLGLVYMNARYYVPGIGRFASADTIVPDPMNPQTFNRYSYSLNSPINLTDPTGHSSCAGVKIAGIPSICEQWSNFLDGITNSNLFNAPGKAVVVESFKAFYEHPLPRAFIEQYAYGNGESITLSATQMREVGVSINLAESTKFTELLNQAIQNGGGTTSISFSDLQTASTHGTLGQFTANFSGELSVLLDESGNLANWSFNGVVNFYDIWDFDPKPWGERQSRYAEVLTRAGNTFLPGEGFEILTVDVSLSQIMMQDEALWIGAGVQGQLSLLAREINQ